MALYKSGPISGGSMKETALWTNPNPSSNWSSDWALNFPSAIGEFDYIKIVYLGVKTDLTAYKSILVAPEDLLITADNKGRVSIAGADTSNTYYRGIYANAVTNKGISIGSAYNGGTTHNELAIPYQIIGITL